MASLASIIGGGICLFLFLRLAAHYYWSRPRGRPPPGPPGLPVVGNVRDIPGSHEAPWLKYHDWCLEYKSDIIRLNALGVNIIVLDTLEAANALLDRRSATYSGRPRMFMLSELAGFAWFFGNMDYGEEWRVCRKMAHHEFHATAFEKYRPILARHARDFVRRVTKESVTHVFGHLKHMTAANIMQVVYGIDVLPEHDPFIELAEVAVDAFNTCAMDSAHLVEVFPFLRHLPAWFPGTGFERRAAVWHEATTRQLEVPYADYKRREELGKAGDCMAKALAEAYGTDEATEHRAKMTTATMYLGGSEIVVAVMHTFFLAMLLYPDVQTRARRELEAALGAHRLPTFADLGSVPYLDALIKELLRWQPIVRLNPPHKLGEDDVYNGYHLEKGSVVFANIWSIMHDENVYPDPHTFAPDRFLKDGALNRDIPDPENAVFGFGRRVCPGRYMTYETLWITIATVLACTEICLAKDGAGREIEVKEDFSGSLVTEPRPFPCCVRFRSEAHTALLDHV